MAFFRDDDGLIIRRSRKTWRCAGSGSIPAGRAETCTQTIAPGQTYVECLWEAPAFQSGTHVCMACAEAFYVLGEAKTK